MWGTFPMLNFSRRTSTLGWSFPPDTQKGLKIAHFCVYSHIGGPGGPKKMWAMVHGSKNCGYWASGGPTIVFSHKKYKILNPVTLAHITTTSV